MNERDIELAKQAWTENDWEGHVDLAKFAALTRADEREACAKMFDEVMSLVPFAQNDQGGCLTCGFTPKLAAKAIRARGNT